MLAIIAYLTLHHCGLPGAAGIASNLEFESGLEPGTVGRSGVGMGQWGGPRRKRLLATLGSAWRDGYAQLDFMLTELREFGLWDRVCRAADAATAARIVMREYELPRARDPWPRMNRARQLYELAYH